MARDPARSIRATRKRFPLAFGSRPLHAVAIIRAAGGVVDICARCHKRSQRIVKPGGEQMQEERKLLAAYDDGEHEPEGKDYSDELEEEIDEDEEDEEISVPLSSEDDGSDDDDYGAPAGGSLTPSTGTPAKKTPAKKAPATKAAAKKSPAKKAPAKKAAKKAPAKKAAAKKAAKKSSS